MAKVIKTNTKLMGKQMKIGEMITIRIYNPVAQKYETSYLIKESRTKIKKILRSHTAESRAHMGSCGNAVAFVFLIGFGENNEYLYDYWFNYHIENGNFFELPDLVQQDEILCAFINEENDIEETILIPNTLKQQMLHYISVTQDMHWTDEEFYILKATAMKRFKTAQGIWDCGSLIA